MSLPRPNEPYQFQANPIWWDSPFKAEQQAIEEYIVLGFFFWAPVPNTRKELRAFAKYTRKKLCAFPIYMENTARLCQIRGMKPSAFAKYVEWNCATSPNTQKKVMRLAEYAEYPFQTDTSVYWHRTLPIFRELGLAPIDVKFPPITAPHVLYTVKKKFRNFLQSFLVIVIFIYLSFLCVKKSFLNSFYDTVYYEQFFIVFNFLTSQQIVMWKLQKKKIRKNYFKFFSNRAFSRFFRDFLHMWWDISVSIPDIWQILAVMCSRNMGLELKTLSAKYFCPSAL
jgi:hypothetical protein